MDNEIDKQICKTLRELDKDIFKSQNDFIKLAIWEYCKQVDATKKDKDILDKIETCVKQAVNDALMHKDITYTGKEESSLNESVEELYEDVDNREDDLLLAQIDKWNE